jgi:hypothetical protein
VCEIKVSTKSSDNFLVAGKLFTGGTIYKLGCNSNGLQPVFLGLKLSGFIPEKITQGAFIS